MTVVKEEHETGHAKVEVGEIVEDRLEMMCLFLVSLGTCVLRYMFFYYENGANNPEGTSVFGRQMTKQGDVLKERWLIDSISQLSSTSW